MVTKDQRRRQLAREKFERQQARRVDHHRRSRRRNAVAAVVVAVVLAGAGTAWAAGAFDGSSKKKDDAAGATPSATAPTTAASQVPDPCQKPAAGNPATATWKTAPAMSIDKSAKYTFTISTTCGDIPISLDAAKAPATVNSFKFLADKGFFDHTRCHRLTTAGIFVLQCGDPTASATSPGGSGGPGYTIPDENLTAFGKADPSSQTVTYPAGTVAMANSGPNTGGSQFFLVYKDSPLQPNYTPFGTMSADGLKVLDKIAAAGENSGGKGDGAPNATAVINKATVTKS